MEKQFVFRALAFTILPTLLLLPGIAHANNVVVNCPGASLNAAVAALPPGPNTITVTGTCNENVSLTDVRSLTIIAGVGGAKIVQPQDSDTFDIVRSQNITLHNLEIVGVPGSMPGLGGSGVFISEQSDVRILGCDIHDNQGGGVFERNSSVLLRNTNIHHNNPFDGLDVTLGSTADVIASTIQNNGSPGGLTDNAASVTGGVGAFVSANSVARFRMNTIIQNNADAGILARMLSTVVLSGTTIQGQNIDGIVVQRGAHLQVNGPALVQGNGGACPPKPPVACGGIFAGGDATVDMAGVGTVSGNHGAGIFIEQGSNIHLNGATISNNTGDGVHARWTSIVDLRDLGGGANTITGNGGASIRCDDRSFALGNVTGFSKVMCEIESNSE